MNYNEKLIFYLLRRGLHTENKASFEFEDTTDWDVIFDCCSDQGVLGIVSDGIDTMNEEGLIPEKHQFSHNMKMQWGYNVMNIEKTFIHQFKVSSMLADEYAKGNIRTVVLKGFSIARMYPKPFHRPCGDLDCFLMGDYEKGNIIAERLGADVNRNLYKHSHIELKHLTVENHQFCTAIRGSDRYKDFERLLQKILRETELRPIKNTKLLSPNPLFNALFLTIHSWGHFMDEGIKIRHICDWTVLMEKHINDIDWGKFVEFLNQRDKKIIRFAECISVISNKYIGAPLPDIFKQRKCPDILVEKVLENVFRKYDSIHVTSIPRWKIRLLIVRNYFISNWKYKEFSEESAIRHTLNSIISFLFERNPHL